MKKNQLKKRQTQAGLLRDKLAEALSDCHKDCSVRFEPNRICLVNSYRIRSRSKRLEICRMIADSGITKRTPESLSAEWFFHNAAYVLHIRRSSSRDVDLDYVRDPRRSVRLCSDICEILHLY